MSTVGQKARVAVRTGGGSSFRLHVIRRYNSPIGELFLPAAVGLCAMVTPTAAVLGLTLLLHASARALDVGPSSALHAWRTERIGACLRTLDRRFDSDYRAFGRVRHDLRYRIQVLVVDDHCGARARVCEAVLDRLAEQLDPCVDAIARTTSPTSRPSRDLGVLGQQLGLASYPLSSASVALDPGRDLLAGSRFDVVLCTDLAVLERVRASARAINALQRTGGTLSGSAGAREEQLLRWSGHPAGHGLDAKVVCATDFLKAGLPPAAAGATLPAQLRRLAPSPEEIRALVDLPDLQSAFDGADEVASGEEGGGEGGRGGGGGGGGRGGGGGGEGEASRRQRQEAALAHATGTATTCCAGLLAFLEAAMREHALRCYQQELATTFTHASDVASLSWDEAQAAMPTDHAVPGGLGDEERRGLFEDRVAVLGGRRSAPARVDVADLGLTMDDLSEPFGGLGV